MALEIICPSCGHRFSIPETDAHRDIGCPSCHDRFRQRSSVELPAATAWPFVLSVGIALMTAGLATNLIFSAVGMVLFLAGLAGWIAQLLPGEGHMHEPLVAPELRPTPVEERPDTVEHLRPGVPGYRFHLPEKIHPISAGIKGGILGGLVMPIPTLIYGIWSGHGIWFPINLLAGMLLPGIDDLPDVELERFNLGYGLVAVFIHAVFSVGFGLLYGVVLPTLPQFPGSALIWGGVLMPLIWTGASYAVMGVVNPALRENVEWRWFLLSQFVYGIVMSWVVFQTVKVPAPPVSGRSATSR
jgi:hypothetical protein